MSAQDITRIDRQISNYISLIACLDACIASTKDWIKFLRTQPYANDDDWRAVIAECHEDLKTYAAKKSEYEARLALLISGCGPS
jgi:hypothetical protein